MLGILAAMDPCEESGSVITHPEANLLTTTKLRRALSVLLSGLWQVGQLKAGIDTLSDGLGILSSLQKKAVIRHPWHVECVCHCTHLQHPPMCPENCSVPYTSLIFPPWPQVPLHEKYALRKG